MQLPRRWKQLTRHPLSAAYPDIDGPAWDQFLADVREHRVLNDRKVTIHEGQVLDGWQLYRACVELNIKPKVQPLPKGITAERFVQIVNDNRRHESQEDRERRAAERRERVAAAKAEGKSNRLIAEEERVSETTIRNDVAALTAKGAQLGPPDGKTVGRDGKARPAQPPKLIPQLQEMVSQGHISPRLVPDLEALDRNQQGVALERMRAGANPRAAIAAALAPAREPGDEAKPAPRPGPQKNGQPLFDWRPFRDHFGGLLRQIDALGRLYGAKETPAADNLRKALSEFKAQFEAWHCGISKHPVPQE